ncbi:DMT family transporter [Desulfopila sp. IMCC35008]|uniref:DMT family transporter n=1 Tax=Desulfopila sp. IMCC35008 TaxID=2653858 RepID=UPI0013CFD151|nr:DMT family transporter [Desulfopila sp. IMCC35008]
MKKALVELNLAVILFGLSGLFGKLISANPVVIVFGRTIFAAITIFLGLWVLKIGIAASTRRALLLMMLSGGVLMVHWVVFFYSIQISTVAVGLIGFSTFPVFVTFLEPLLCKQKFRNIDIASGLLVTLGLLFVAPGMDLSDSNTIGLLWAIVSGGLYAVLALLNRRLVAGDSFMVVAFYQHSAAALCLLPFVFIQEPLPDTSTLLLLFVLGVLCTALPQTFFIKSLTALKAQLASIIASLEPVYGIIFAALLLGEVPEVRTVAGATIVFGAVVLAMRAHSKVESDSSTTEDAGS